jgi:DNA modification methylase
MIPIKYPVTTAFPDSLRDFMAKKAKQIEHVAVADLIPYARNHNKHPDKQIKQIAASIREFGFTNPVIISADNTIRAGHGRVLAAEVLGLTTVPCLRFDEWTPSQAQAYVIVDNQLARNSEVDDEMLRLEVVDLHQSGFDLELLGLDDPESFLEENKGGTEGLTDPDEVPEVAQNIHGVERGQIWQLGDHRMMCGDSTSKDDVAKLMAGEKADMVFTDPPYNVGYEGSDGQSIKNDKMSIAQFSEFCKSFYQNYFDSMVEGGAIYVFHSDSMRHIFTAEFIDAGFHFSGNLVWNKQSLNMGRFDYHMKHEPCLYGWKKGASHKWYSDRKQTSVFDFDKPAKNDLHPTMKPIGLVEYFVGNSSKAKDMVLDLFLGSGTTLIACEKMGRQCYGMELDEHFCSVIIERWQKFTGKEAKLASKA